MEQLVLTALGEDRTGIVNELSQVILEAGGNIEDSRMSVLGGEFALMMLVSGPPAAITELIGKSNSLGKSLGLTVVSKRTRSARARLASMLPYVVEVVAMDHPGIVHEVAEFFAGRRINIEDLSTSTYRAAHTGTPMFSMRMVVTVPGNANLGELRQRFADFCERFNLDASLEPEGR